VTREGRLNLLHHTSVAVYRENRQNLSVMVDAMRSINIISEFRGRIIEFEFLEKLSNLEGPQELIWVGSELQPLEEASTKSVAFDKMEMSFFDSYSPDVKIGVHYIPKSKSKESIDSFFVCQYKRFCDTASDSDLCGVAIQVTTADKHGIKNKGLLDLRNGCGLGNVVILFVTEPGGFSTPQHVLTNDKTVYKQNHGEGCSFPQYILRLQSGLVHDS